MKHKHNQESSREGRNGEGCCESDKSGESVNKMCSYVNKSKS